MAKTMREAYFIASGASSETLHSNAGRILGVLIGNSSGSADVVTFYDATAATPGTEILVINLSPYESTFLLVFNNNNAIPFSNGLHVDPSNANVNVWSIDYG
ncbi:MAG: hypothetical protein PVH95_10365 [Anaerolineae bacterium]|jgi:hypothetical protein